MSLRVTCPECSAAFSVDDGMRGKKVRCRECDYAFTASYRRDDDDDDDDRPAAPPATKGKGGLIAVLLIGAASLGLLGLVCTGLAAALYFTLRSDEPVQVVHNGPPVIMPPDLGQNFPNPDNNGGPIVVQDQDNEHPVVNPNPDPNPNPNVDPKPAAPGQIDAATRERVKESTVYLRVRMPNGGIAEGSGFFAAEPGIVITNAHVLGMRLANSRPPENVDVVVRAGQPGEQTLRGTILGVDRVDLAVIRVQGNNLPPPLAVESAATLGETQNVYAFGFPLGKRLGTEISISPGVVSSLRKGRTGRYEQVQFNGDMAPGNSGGPVVDAAGRVVGIAVAIIKGTRINFAIAGDMVKPILDGRVQHTTFGERFQDGAQVKLPIKYELLNPLGRVNSVRVDVWTGSPGADRPPSFQLPPAQPGDSAVQSMTFPCTAGIAYGDVPLPTVPPGQAIWVRPVLLGPGERYLTAKTLPPSTDAPLQRIAADVHVRLKPPDERTLKIKSEMRLSIFEGKNEMSKALKLEADVLETVSTHEKGTEIRLSIGPNRFTDEIDGRPPAIFPTHLSTQLRSLSPSFLVDPTGRIQTFIYPNVNPRLPEKDDLEFMRDRVCNMFEETCISMPNRMVNPLETWPVRVLKLMTGKDRIKKRRVDLFLTCKYEGVRTDNNRRMAFIGLTGIVKDRDKAEANPLGMGKVTGRALFDLDGGFIANVHLALASEMDFDGIDLALTEDIDVSRIAGNPLGIKAVVVAKKNPDPKTDPKAAPKTDPKTDPKADPKAAVVIKKVLNTTAVLTKNDFLGPNGRKHKAHDVKLQAGTTYVIEMKQAPGSPINPFLMLMDPTGKEVAKDDDSGGNKDAKITYTAERAGTYRVIATTRIGIQVGAYQLAVNAKD